MLDDHLVGVERLRRQRLLAGKGQQPLRQRGGPLGRRRRRGEETLDGEVALLDAAGDEIVRAHDHAEHIVEVVRDAAGELAERLHFLRLPKLAFGRFAARHLLEQLALETARRSRAVVSAAKDLRVKRAISRPTPQISDKGDRRADLQAAVPERSATRLPFAPAARPPSPASRR